ncbi:MAG TPA: NBR1-Ig-like domain-containing protein [Anaerolineales bacterium]|nr:NBR1-Ig-like domain-containing protein [Anaerolineales bacterium]
MFEFRTYKILALLTCLVLVASACGSSAQNDAIISTAVAQTVQAGESNPVLVTASTDTPVPALDATLTPAITPTSEPTALSAPSDPDCIHANLISEYPPDGTIYTPGDPFTKTWSIQNNGNCTWDSTYKLIFWSGDQMGSSSSYPLPETVVPGDQLDITINLQAPQADGTYTSYWRLQTPWNANFGVGQYSQAFYANIVVFKKPNRHFGITNVTYILERNPPTGCPVNVRYRVYATVTTNGPYEFSYFWDQSDQNESAVKAMIFYEAGSKTVSREWMIGRGDSPNPRWMEFVETDPATQYFKSYGKTVILNNCP